jgi:L-threonylcarbamoyladenylate synthase
MPSEAQRGDAAQAIEALCAGELIVMPTDTVYGVAAHPQLAGARAKIAEAKGRDVNKPIALLVSDTSTVTVYGGKLSPTAEKLAGKFWPGALTLVVPCGDRMEGFRVPNHPLALEIVSGTGGILYATSANRSGEEPADSAGAAAGALSSSVAVVVDGPPAPSGRPSTVVKVINDTVEVLREGSIPKEEVEACLAT